MDGRFHRALDALIESKLQKRLEKICVELGQRCDLRVKASVDGAMMPIRNIQIGSSGAIAQAEARVVLRPGARQSSIRVAYKVVVHGLASEANFSGFMSDGRIDVSDAGTLVRVNTVVLNYGDWSFSQPFDFEARG